MDAVDVRILRAMGVFPYGAEPQGRNALKATHVAKLAGLSPEAVRERVARMEASGLIAGYEVFPNLRHLGLDTAGYLFRVADEDRRAAFAKDLGVVEGVIEAHMFLGNEFCIDLAYAGEGALKRRLELIGRLSDDHMPTRFFGWQYPEVARELTSLDWRIIQALRGRAKTPLPDIAREIGVGYRTVKRHFDQMADEGSLYMAPVLDPAHAGGAFPFWLFFYFAPDADRATTKRILAAFEERQIFNDVPPSPEFGNVGVILFAEKVAEVEALRQEGAAIPGIAKCRSMVPYGQVGVGPWIEEAIAARAGARPVAKPA